MRNERTPHSYFVRIFLVRLAGSSAFRSFAKIRSKSPVLTRVIDKLNGRVYRQRELEDTSRPDRHLRQCRFLNIYPPVENSVGRRHRRNLQSGTRERLVADLDSRKRKFRQPVIRLDILSLESKNVESDPRLRRKRGGLEKAGKRGDSRISCFAKLRSATRRKTKTKTIP